MKKILLFLLLVFPIVAKAQLELPFPIKLVNSSPVDFWYYESDGTPYDNTGEVISQVLSAIRYRGMTFNVNGVEYWFGAGIADVDLVIKSTGGNLTGAVTSTGLATSLGSFTSNALGTAISDPVRTVTGTDAIVQADNGRTIYFNSATPFNFTIDALTINTFTMFRNIGTATVSFVDGSGVTSTGATALLADEVGGIEYIASTTPIISKAGSGGMLESVYDPATIAEQLVGLTASQALTNKSINGVTLNGAGSSSLFLNQAGGYTSPVSSFWSLATGATLTGVNTITSNAFSQLIFTGTATAGSAGLSFTNYGGTVTAFNGTGVNIYSKWNPVFNGNGSGNTNIVAQFSHTGTGGTSPNYVDLMVGDFTAVTGYLFQAQTGYYSGNFRFDSNIRDNRDNNIVTQSSSATASNRTLTIGNTSYAVIDFSNKGAVTITQGVLPSVAPLNAFKITGGAHTALTASTEVRDIYFNLSRTVQSATGTIANNRYVYIENPTHGFVGASTSTREATIAIKGAPIAGTNATLTTSIGLEVESAAVGAGTVSSYGAYFNAQSGATNNNALGLTGNISSESNFFSINAKNLGTVNSGLQFDFSTDGIFTFRGFTGSAASVVGNTVAFSSGSGYGTGNNAAGDFQIYTGTPNGSGSEGSVKIQSRSSGLLSFFNASGVVKQSVNTILVNNVTSGGTLSTIADYTDLIIYANDAAAIRNNMFRMAEKILKLETALRNYGLATN